MARPTLKRSGFTLIELLIVVVILSTLAAIVVPQFASSSDSAKLAAAKSSLNGIRSALAIYKADKSEYPLITANTFCAGTSASGTNAEEILLDSLSFYSNGSGELCKTKSDSHPQGPYIRARAFPDNPLVGTNTVNQVSTSDLGVSAAGAQAWLYQPATGEFIINDSNYENL